MEELNLSTNIIREKIYIIRSKKVMFDKDLAMLYGVTTKALNQAVKRNIKRFPEDFMFQLNKEESDMFSRSQSVTLNEDDLNLKSQIAISSYKKLKNKDKNLILRSQIVTLGWGEYAKYQPYVFTEQGIAMLSSVLKSDKAIYVNIQIIRIFTKLREMIDTYKELREKVEEMEKSNTKNFHQIFDIIKILIREKEEPRNTIGFTVDNK
jgi:uncharacterized protein (UPF0147 family)